MSIDLIAQGLVQKRRKLNRQPEKLRPLVTPRPRRDDESDDTARLQEALAEAEATGGVVHLAAGHYVTENLKIGEAR